MLLLWCELLLFVVFKVLCLSLGCCVLFVVVVHCIGCILLCLCSCVYVYAYAYVPFCVCLCVGCVVVWLYVRLCCCVGVWLWMVWYGLACYSVCVLLVVVCVGEHGLLCCVRDMCVACAVLCVVCSCVVVVKFVAEWGIV